MFSKFKILRSSELVYVAIKEGLLEFPAAKEQSIEAALYALKYKGCAISWEEIKEIKEM
jgi:hypothetical protein